MSEKEKKRPRIYDLLNAETEKTYLCLFIINNVKKITEKNAF